MTARRRLSPKTRAALFVTHKGICWLCGEPIKAGETWHVEHKLPLCLGGSNDDDNLGPAHADCNASKAAKEVRALGKIRRLIKGKTPKRKIPSKPFDKRFTKRFDGSVVERAA